MADLLAGISGRVEEGETLKAVTTLAGASVQWQAYVSGAWVDVGPAGSSTYTIPAGAIGLQYRVVATYGAEVFASQATAPAVKDASKKAAPTLSGSEFDKTATEGTVLEALFSSLSFSDADKSNYGGGSLLVSNTEGAGGLLSIRLGGTAAGDFSFNATTGELLYAFRSGTATVIGSVDPAHNGAGTHLKVSFNANATKSVVDALIDKLNYTCVDDSPAPDRILTLRVTDPTGGTAQRAVVVAVTGTADAPVFSGPANFEIDENQAAVGLLAAADPDREAGSPQGITYTLVAGEGAVDNALFTLDAATGELRFAQAPDYEGSHDPVYSVRVRASDSNGGAVEQVVAIGVRDVNESPVIAASSELTGTVAEPVGTGKLLLDVAGQWEGGLAFSFDGAGKLLVLARCSDPANPEVRAALCRYDEAGGLDMNFAGDGQLELDMDPMALTVDAHGRILTAGYEFNGYGEGGTGADWVVQRHLADGTLDLSFGDSGRIRFDLNGGEDYPIHAWIQPSGKILVFGTGPVLACFNEDGSLDTGFASQGVWVPDASHGMLNGFAVDGFGRILVSSQHTDPATGQVTLTVARYAPDGNLDIGFGNAGLTTLALGTDAVQNAYLTTDALGAVLLGWSTAGANPDAHAISVARFEAGGQLDAAFGDGGITHTGHSAFWFAMFADAQGRTILQLNQQHGGDFLLARLHADGSSDSSFAGGMLAIDFDGRQDEALDIQVRPDGSLLVGGYSSLENSDDLAFARVHTDGTLDENWGTVVADRLQAAGTLHASDVDGPGVLVWSGSAAGTYGHLVVDAAGEWTYTLDPALDATRALQQGEVGVDRFTATVTDSGGLSAACEIVVEVVGSGFAGLS